MIITPATSFLSVSYHKKLKEKTKKNTIVICII